MTLTDCPRCGAKPGKWHARGCDIEQSPYCGVQAVCCDPDADSIPLDDRLRWTGHWPGEAEAITSNWYCKQTPAGWRACRPDDPDGVPDLNRVRKEMIWDRDGKRFVQRRPKKRITQPTPATRSLALGSNTFSRPQQQPDCPPPNWRAAITNFLKETRMDEDQHGSVTDDSFTKEQQDVYFQKERCPFCRSEELLFASRERRDCGRTKAREVICDECEEEWVEVHYRDVGTSFLLKPGEAEEYFDDDDEDDTGADDPDEDDDPDGGEAEVSVTGASADT